VSSPAESFAGNGDDGGNLFLVTEFLFHYVFLLKIKKKAKLCFNGGETVDFTVEFS
jgi:hypothetical protein